ncbi:MAG: GerMN domain-containing protein [Butyrivibrio sp.]|nr:GerMN domain-containing protein [Butyrivibrio sp.]
MKKGLRVRAGLAALLLLAAAAFTLTACGGDSDGGSEQGYVMYYYDASNMELVTEPCDDFLYYSDEITQAASLLYQMLYPTDSRHESVFAWNSRYRDNESEQRREALNALGSGEVPEILGISSLQKNKRILNVYFKDEGYYEMDELEEVICRAAVVQTLLQLRSVDYIGIYINDQPLTIDNKVVGLMNENNFITDTDASLNQTNYFDTIIYYSDSEGKSLVGETVRLQYSSKTSMEQTVIERLLAGPGVKGSKSTLAANTKLLTVSTRDGVCYVNFDSAFMTSLADVSAEVTLYSIVNSLCELTKVKKVQIMVNGAQDGTFRDSYSLSAAYERNLDIITDVYEETAQ